MILGMSTLFILIGVLDYNFKVLCTLFPRKISKSDFETSDSIPERDELARGMVHCRSALSYYKVNYKHIHVCGGSSTTIVGRNSSISS